MDTPKSLEGRTALVTGASRGIGASIALAMADAGAEVVIAARSSDRLDVLARQIKERGGQVRVATADFSRRAEVIALAAQAADADILVNNAATAVKMFPVIEARDQDWAEAFEVDFFAPLILIRELGRRMTPRGRGSIINLSSIVAQKHAPLTASYATSKAALEALTRIVALELAPHGVRSNAISPGLIETDLTRATLDDAAWAHMLNAIPVGRAGRVQDVADLAVFLASDAAFFITGQVIKVDGGATAGDFAFAGAASAGGT